jgi:hypothetical protein
LRPKFGSQQGSPRRDPMQAGWLVRPATGSGEGGSLASVPPLRAPRLFRKSGCGGACGCRSCKGGKA